MPSDAPPSTITRWHHRVLAVLLLLVGAGLALAPPAATAPTASPGAAPAQGGACAPDDAYLAVLQVEGRLDAVMVDFVKSEVTNLADSCAVGIMLQLDSNGVVGESGDLEGMLQAIEEAPKPVTVWVGPSGSRAVAEAVSVLAVADRTGLSPGSHVEVTPEFVEARGITAEELGTTAFGDRVGAERAVELGLVDSGAPVIGDFFVEIPEVETRVVGEGEDARREPVTPPLFAKLPLTGQLMHTVASPAVAYLLFVIGLALLLFELYSAGVGIAGMVGAGSLLLACYGLVSLPTNPLGVVLILLAMFGYAVDVQTGVPRLWTGIATISFVGGSLWLFDGLSLSWITLAFAFVGMSLFMLRGMPVMVRSRFSTSTIDRKWLVGERGTADTRLSPEGTITLRGAPWSARAKETAPIEPGTDVTVVGIEGFVLTVAPNTGHDGDIVTDVSGHVARSS